MALYRAVVFCCLCVLLATVLHGCDDDGPACDGADAKSCKAGGAYCAWMPNCLGERQGGRCVNHFRRLSELSASTPQILKELPEGDLSTPEVLRRLVTDANNCPGGLAGKACRPLDPAKPGLCGSTSATSLLCNAAGGCQCIDCPPAPSCHNQCHENCTDGEACYCGGGRTGLRNGTDHCTDLAMGLDMSVSDYWDKCATPCACNYCFRQVVYADGRLYTTSAGTVTARISHSSAMSNSTPEECDWSTWPLNVTVTQARLNEKLQAKWRDEAPSAFVVDHFKRVALAEHVSVASFSRTVLDLMEHAAPARLLDQTLAAAREEIQHAQMAFSLVRKWSQLPVQPSGFDGQLGVQNRVTLPEFARRTVEEACVGETPAVLRAALSLHFAQNPEVREYLRTVLADEQRHAELAWSTVQWSLLRAHSIGGEKLVSAVWHEVNIAVQSALRTMTVAVTSGTAAVEDTEAVAGLLRFGVLPDNLRLVVAQLAVPLIEQIHSALFVPVEGSRLTEGARTSFESSTSHLFKVSLKKLESSVVGLEFPTQGLV